MQNIKKNSRQGISNAVKKILIKILRKNIQKVKENQNKFIE